MPLSDRSLSASYFATPEFLDVQLSGFASPAGTTAILWQIASELKRTGYRRVLIDCSLVIGQLAKADHSAVGAEIARILGPVRCAGVAPPGRPVGEIAPTARREGADYAGFGTRAEAIAWLTDASE
jgi:hypothetical protein